MTTVELLNNLKDLQSVDKRIFELKRDLAEIPINLKALDAELEALDSKVRSSEEHLTKLQMERKSKEIDLGEKENAIKKYQGQLYQVKTNAEYTALEKEIGGLTADKSVLEEEILVMFDKIEWAEKEVSGGRAKLGEEKKSIESQKTEISSKKVEIEKETSELDEKRKTIVPLIDKPTLSRYESILHNKDGMALVAISGANCGGCFVNIPPQMVNEIRLRERIIYCLQCARMLYTEG